MDISIYSQPRAFDQPSLGKTQVVGIWSVFGALEFFLGTRPRRTLNRYAMAIEYAWARRWDRAGFLCQLRKRRPK